MSRRKGSRTLLMSVLMSSPGPIVVGLGLLVGKSTTQLADFVRRSAELLAIIAAALTYRLTGDAQPERKARLERGANRFVGGAMCLSGAAMVLLALFSEGGEKGNVLPGLSIAVMGVIANCIFWRRYARLGKQENDAILLVQSRLYRAKTLVDGCVTAALATVALFPASPAAALLDTLGTAVVALYLLWSGIQTIRESK